MGPRWPKHGRKSEDSEAGSRLQRWKLWKLWKHIVDVEIVESDRKELAIMFTVCLQYFAVCYRMGHRNA